ncbi:MAG: FAD-dependent oxidoreductase [bacterium]|nr:flavoprotein [Deltaproteobacteria bacterium]MCP4904137.1 FAD-dependent oxidoreductase [bacterium]
MPERFATDRLRDARQISGWAESADVIVVGLGSAGACAALEAHRAGARVLILEKQSQGGGTSALAAGQFYLGGGTALQGACGFEDSLEAMTTYMSMACGPGAPEDKIDLFVKNSIEHYDWLVEQGIPFRATFVPTTEATNPPGPDGLTYTGSEPAHPWCEFATPAPRGHNVENEGDSGIVLMKVLIEAVEREGIEILTNVETTRLAMDEGGRIAGVGVREGSAEGAHESSREKWFAASRGVILCTGGFGFNEEMLARYAPPLLGCAAVGSEAEDGLGIRLGMAAGGDAIRMDAGCVMIPFSKPRSLVRGIIVNGRGERFINEDVYQAVHGDIALKRQAGVSYLIHDADSYSKPLLPFPDAAEADSPEELEEKLGLPPGSLVTTLERWNEGAERGEDPLFHKGTEWITPLEKPPFRAIDLRREAFPYPFFTLGGLRTDLDGRVLTPENEIIEGLFAAGRTSSGIPAQGYNSGMSLSDCTFFGRRAGRAAGTHRPTR